MTRFSLHLVRASTGLLLSTGALGVLTAGAQTPDARWQPWLGCWAPSDAPSQGIAANNTAAGLVCVVPAASGAGVEVATVANGVVVHRERLNPTGARTAKTLDNCPGWESATWSADSRRLMLRSEYVCGNNIKVRGSGVFAISPTGEWIQVQGSSVGAGASARAVRYTAVGLQLERAAIGADTDSTRVHLVTVSTGFGTISARSVAGENVLADHVLEVARHVDGPVAEAWLNEVEQRFLLDGRELVRLADAGLSPRLIDLMVALSYPQRFAVKRTEPVRADLGSRGTVSGGGAGYNYRGSPSERWECGFGNSMLSYGYYGSGCYSGYYGYGYSAIGRYGAYGYGPYGSGGYGYNGYNGYNGYYTGQQPIIIIQRPADNSPSRTEGRAVNGSGYTRRTSEPSSNPQRSSGSSSSSSSSSSGSSGSSSGSSGAASSSAGSSSSSGSSSGDRTAKPRVPPG